MHVKYLCIHQSWILDNFYLHIIMRSSIQCIVTYGVVKIYAVQIYMTCT